MNTLLGKQLTEADWRLFTTLIRFDSVYLAILKQISSELVITVIYNLI